MTTIRKHLVTAFAALSMGALAIGAHAQATSQATTQAQTPEGRYSHAEHQQKRAEFAAKRAEFAARRAAKLHEELKITPAQEAAWNTFVASMKPAARHADGQRPDRAAWANLSAPERMEKHIEMQKRRTAAMEQRLGALNSFYAVLTPEQKKTFDEKAAHLQGHFGKHRGMRGNWQQRGNGDTARG